MVSLPSSSKIHLTSPPIQLHTFYLLLENKQAYKNNNNKM